MAAPKTSGCRIVRDAAHQAPYEYPIVAHDVRLFCARKCWTTHWGRSCDSQVSVCGSPGPPLVHSVSRLAGVSIRGMTTSEGARRCSAVSVSIDVRKLRATKLRGPLGKPCSPRMTG